jgi:hypothetical protein
MEINMVLKLKAFISKGTFTWTQIDRRFSMHRLKALIASWHQYYKYRQRQWLNTFAIQNKDKMMH